MRGADRVLDLYQGADRTAKVYHGDELVFKWPPWLDHPDLDLWLSGRDFRNSVDGATVSSWVDRAQGITLTATGSPVARPTGTLGLNNLPCVEGSGSGQYFDGGSVLDYHGTTGLTVIALIHPGYFTANGGIIGRSASSNRGWQLAVLNASGVIQFSVATSTSAATARVSADLNLKNFPSVMRGRYNGGTGELSVWVNGIQMDGSLSGSVPATIGGTGGSSLRVLNNGFSNVLPAHLSEVLVFGAALSDADAEAFEAELIRLARLYVFEETDIITVNDHQGVATDGSTYWTFDTQTIVRRDAAWASLGSVSGSGIFSGLSGLNHVSDGFYLGGSLYAALTDFPATGATRYIGVFDATTLARTTAVSIGTRQPSGICYDPDRDIVWGVDHTISGVQLHQWDRATLAYIDTLVTDFGFDTQVQGVTYRDGLLWVTFGNDAETNGLLAVVDPVTGIHRPIYRRNASEAEGLDYTGDDFLWVLDDGTAERVHIFTVTAP